MSRIPVKRTRLEKTIIISLIVILIVWIFLMLFLPAPPIKQYAYQVKCRAYMRTLTIALVIYADEYNNMYPTPEKWCDLLIDKCEVPEETFRSHIGKGNRCNYALNPNCDPSSPKDMVLLFESTSGWNQFGGPELFNTQNHDGEGCNVAFNDGTVEFVKTDQLKNLKWENSEIIDDNE